MRLSASLYLETLIFAVVAMWPQSFCKMMAEVWIVVTPGKMTEHVVQISS